MNIEISIDNNDLAMLKALFINITQYVLFMIVV